MSAFRGLTRAAFLSAFLLATALPAQPNQEESDDATARLRAQDEWYNENYGSTRGRRNGTPWNGRYRRFLLDAAAKEKQAWAALLPGPTAAVVSGTSWVNLGPTRSDFIKNGSTTLNQTDSGRIRNIAVDPANANRIFVATAGGGLWRTTDGGSTWTALSESLGTLACGWVALSGSNTLYLGLGDPFDGTGLGIVKSTDGGNTWGPVIYLGDSTAVTQVMVAAADPNVVLVATDKGLFRSADAGATYSLIPLTTGQAEAPYVWSLAHTGGNGYALALEALSSATTGTSDGQIWYSTNNGAGWTRSTGFTRTGGLGRATIASAPSQLATLYAAAAVPNSTSSSDFADLYKSTNGGQTWTALGAAGKRYSNRNRESSTLGTIFNGQGWYDQLLMVHPTNPNTFFLGGALLLAKSTDGGSSFSQVTNWLAQFNLPYVHADFHAGAFVGTGSTMYVGTDGGLFRSTDSGATWVSTLNNGMITHLLYSVGSSPATGNAVIGGMQDNGTRLRSGATSTFNQVLGGDGFGSDIHQTNGQLMLGSLYYTRVYKSTNGGSTFTQSCTGIQECNNSSAAPFFTKVLRWEGDATSNTVFTYANTRAYKSTNYAGSWNALGTAGLPTTNLFLRGLGVAKTNSNVIGLVANSGRVFLSTNGGASWAAPAGALPDNGFSLSDIAFDPTNTNTIYVASVAPDSTKAHLWKSTNGGATWSRIDQGAGFPAGIPVNFIKTDPGNANTLFAGTHLGIYRSTDAGATWARFGAGLPLVSVSDMYISADSTLVRAATYGRGFWQLNP